MADRSAIEWTAATWNPWQGCRRKSEGCRFCYMFRDMARYGRDPKDIHRSLNATFLRPLKWQREVESGERVGRDRLVFTCSWSDWFIKEADVWRDEAWNVIRRCPGLIFQILTKRPDRMADHLPSFWSEIRERCWLGVSAEDQRNYDLRRPYVDTDLAPVMWWSLEPLLGPIAADYAGYTHKPGWCVVGGESGNASDPIRPMHPDWVRSLRNECKASGVPFLFKQWGEWFPSGQFDYDTGLPRLTGRQEVYIGLGSQIVKTSSPYSHGCPCCVPRDYESMVRVGKSEAGRIVDGVTHDGYPEKAGIVA